ncbi:MAG: UDP-N-acetylmuramate--L-alanine ligase [Chloroflexi bacterium]|nr:UDP-N-acetylmuramate--L-alanine ligase [Chloroflexota bacterium]
MYARQTNTDPLPQRIHLVGIGGIGLSAIARVLAMRGHVVSGSDLQDTPILEGLRALGVTTYQGHAAHQVGDAELVVMSSAVPEDNPEVIAARAAGVEVLKRQAFMARLLAGYRTIAVAGTHGKTTTSAMIATILETAGLAPSFIIGGIVAEWGTNAKAGNGDWFVIEADEYERMFHGLSPTVAVVTNIEMDHPDCYRSLEEMREAFAIFVQGISQDGCLVACTDSPELMRVLRGLWQGRQDVEAVTYGHKAADYTVSNMAANAWGGVNGEIIYRGKELARLHLRVPGEHNLLNATAAWLTARRCGVDGELAAKALATFRGVRRRFEFKGEAGGVLVIDDYAHHPTEIRATLAAARWRYPQQRLWAVFQPHTYSRTEALFDEFTRAFDGADRVIIADIYAARAKERPTVSAQDLVAAMEHTGASYGGSPEQILAELLADLRPGDVLLTMGAGDGYLVGERVLTELAKREGDGGLGSVE